MIEGKKDHVEKHRHKLSNKEKLLEYPTAFHSLDPAAQELAKLAEIFESRSKKLQQIIYPAMFAFVLLASYGFFLIYSVTSNVTTIAENMILMTKSISGEDSNIGSLAKSMVTMQKNVQNMANSVGEMKTNINSLNDSVYNMKNSVADMGGNLTEMTNYISVFDPALQNIDRSTQDMANSVGWMERDMDSLEDNFSPDGMIRNIMPF